MYMYSPSKVNLHECTLFLAILETVRHHKQLSQVKGSQSTATSFNINFFLVKYKL